MSIEKGELSKALSAARGCEPSFPMIGIDGYDGEQDGDTVSFSDIYYADTLAAADAAYPEPLPSCVRVHWARYSPSGGWEWVLGGWDSDSEWPDDWRWPSTERSS